MNRHGNGRKRPLLLTMLALAAMAALATVAATITAAPAYAADHRIGFGVHHWQTVDDLAKQGFSGLDDSGTSSIVSYQYMPEGIFSLEADLEYFADGFGGSTKSALSPQVYLLVGHGLYAGVGAGVVHSDGKSSDPFFAAKAGFDISILPHLSVDLNANYRFDDWSLIDKVSTDTVTFGAIVRIRL